MSTESTNSLDSLSSRQRKALALLGITHGDQLCGADESTLWNELTEACRLFPEEAPLSRSEWEETIVPLTRNGRSGAILPSGKTLDGDSSASLARPFPELRHRYGSTELDGPIEQDMLPYRRRHRKGVRHQHIIRPLFISLSVLLFYACAAGALAMIVYLLLYIGKPDGRHMAILFALLAGLLPFLLLGWMCKCSVCKIGIFSWKRYHRNRLSHSIPLLGCQLPTALHILIFRWFRCPSCGTAQELRRK